MPNDNTLEPGMQPIRITFFDFDQTNCFPDCSMDPTWEQVMSMYRMGAGAGKGEPKGSRGYAIFARLKPGTEQSCAAIQVRRQVRRPDWVMSDPQRLVVMTEGYRDETHMIEATAVVIDYDGDTRAEPNWSPDAWPCEVFAHSTHSWSPAAPGSWRVFLRLDVPIPIERYNDLIGALRQILPKNTNLRNGVQPAFLPTCAADAQTQFHHLHAGQPLNWQALLEALPPPPTRPIALVVPEVAANDMPSATEQAVVIGGLAAVWPESGCGLCYETAMAFGGVMGGSSWPEECILDFAYALFEAAKWEDVPKCVGWSMASVERRREGGRAFGWPKLRENLTDAEGPLRMLADMINPPEVKLSVPVADLAPRVGIEGIDDEPETSAITVGDNEDLAQILCANELKGAVYDGGSIWMQAANHVWQEVTEPQASRMVAQFSGAQYAFTTNEKNVTTCKVITVSASKCRDVYTLLCHTLERRGFFAGAPNGVAFQNGFLDCTTRELGPLTNARVRRTLPFDYDTQTLEKKPPMHWLRFVQSIWGDDHESIQCLHEILGYLLSGSLDMQKMFVFLGPSRAGKGVVLHLVRALFGSSCGSFKIAALDQQFAMQTFFGHTVMTDPDVRKARGIKVNTGVIAERLLSTVAGDEQNVPQKYERDLSTVLPTRILMAANPPFGLLDEGGALSKRMIILPFPTSFFGREDVGLLDRLLTELPGIVALALEALSTLAARGRFQEPKAAEEDRKLAQHAETPALGFLEEVCECDPAYDVPKPQLYECYKQWCERVGGRPAHMNVFAAVCKQQGIGTEQRRVGGGLRFRVFTGVRIAEGENHEKLKVVEGV